MTIPRYKQINIDITPWYHCTTRCVRKILLCGYDHDTKTDYSYRREWIENRILKLASAFCIHLGGYAIMSNHYHVVLRVDFEQSLDLSDEEVISRWHSIFAPSPMIARYLRREPLTDLELEILAEKVMYWRDQLASVSKFMSALNQFIARKANKEDGTSGHFWEARFDSQAILDNDALIRTLAYVDLNPVRASIAKTPENSRFTSIYHRLRNPDNTLIPFLNPNANPFAIRGDDICLPLSLHDYLDLLDWTGRQLRDDKTGSIPDSLPSIFHRLNYSQSQWIKSQTGSKTWRQRALGSLRRIRQFCRFHDRNWIWVATEQLIE